MDCSGIGFGHDEHHRSMGTRSMTGKHGHGAVLRRCISRSGCIGRSGYETEHLTKIDMRKEHKGVQPWPAHAAISHHPITKAAGDKQNKQRVKRPGSTRMQHTMFLATRPGRLLP